MGYGETGRAREPVSAYLKQLEHELCALEILEMDARTYAGERLLDVIQAEAHARTLPLDSEVLAAALRARAALTQAISQAARAAIIRDEAWDKLATARDEEGAS